jgi:hypothetical protein
MASAAFFVTSTPARAPSGNRLAAAVAHTVRIAKAASDNPRLFMSIEKTRF